MDFYLDENLPPRIAKAINEFDEENRVLHTQIEFEKGIEDEDLISNLNEAKASVLVTNDLKFKHRLHQYKIYKMNNLSVFMISLPSGADDWLKMRTITNKWELITRLSNKHKHPFICRIYLRKNPQMGGKEYAFL